MEQRLEKLRQLGCDVDKAIERFMGDKELYFVCFGELLSDVNFDKLGESLREQDYENAKHYSHMLKSVYANMGLTPLYTDCVAILDPLRSGDTGEHLLESYGRMKGFMQVLKEI